MVQHELRDHDSYCCLPPGPSPNNSFHGGDCLKPERMTDPERRHEQILNHGYNTITKPIENGELRKS